MHHSISSSYPFVLYTRPTRLDTRIKMHKHHCALHRGTIPSNHFLFPIYGKKNIGRYLAFVVTTMGFSAIVVLTWEAAEARYGFIKTFVGLCVLGLASLIWIMIEQKLIKKGIF